MLPRLSDFVHQLRSVVSSLLHTNATMCFLKKKRNCVGYCCEIHVDKYNIAYLSFVNTIGLIRAYLRSKVLYSGTVFADVYLCGD